MKISNLKFKIRKQKEGGQVLLITVMLLATVLTVVLSASFKSTTDTQTTKLEEESQKALAAAEAAIEEALKTNGSIAFGDLGAGYSSFTGGASISQTSSNVFTTPLLQKDEQYTLYLQDYSSQTKTFTGLQSKNEDINVCFKSSSDNKPVIEITLLKTSGVKKFLVQTEGETTVTGAGIVTADSCTDNGAFDYGYTVTGGGIGTDTKLMMVRMLNSGGKLFFKRNSNFPLQGKMITSEARSNTGVTKVVELFQSYPQIPSEFFVSSF